jgi:pantothenate kinase-related protein Tda10
MTSGKGSSSKAIVVYHQLDRYSGDLTQRISYDDYLKTHFKKNRRNVSIDYVLNGSCTKGKKKKF